MSVDERSRNGLRYAGEERRHEAAQGGRRTDRERDGELTAKPPPLPACEDVDAEQRIARRRQIAAEQLHEPRLVGHLVLSHT